jgi:hypothetical protein
MSLHANQELLPWMILGDLSYRSSVTVDRSHAEHVLQKPMIAAHTQLVASVMI